MTIKDENRIKTSNNNHNSNIQSRDNTNNNRHNESGKGCWMKEAKKKRRWEMQQHLTTKDTRIMGRGRSSHHRLEVNNTNNTNGIHQWLKTVLYMNHLRLTVVVLVMAVE